MNQIKRMLALLTALALAVTALAGLTVTASAAGYEETDSYVLNFSNQAVEGYEDYDNKRLYASPYRTDIYVTEGDGLSNWNWCSGCVLNMINTTRIAAGGEGAYASIGVYCVDAVTDGVPGYSYRRVNLEDSGYFSAAAAGRLRSIILASFPHQQDMEALAAQVNAWDDANGDRYDDVQEMNYSEAISATQSVIWTLTNEGKLGDPVYAGYAPAGFGDEEIVYPESMDFPVSDYTANNINALAAYLNALEPTAPRDTVVTDAAFGETELTYARAEDGTYTAAVRVVVSARVDDGDDLTVTALCGDAVSESQPLRDGTNAYTFTFEGLATADQAVTVNIDGQQEASDVFFFDPLNGRDASQSMAGYDSSTLPVHAEVTLAPRVLNLDKVGKVTTVTKQEDGTETTEVKDVPLANIDFEIYFVGTMADFVNGRIHLENAPQVTEEKLAVYVTGKSPIATITTDENGKASYNFTLEGQPDGIYIVKELHNAQTEAPMAPFYIAVPMTDGTTTLNIAPKNDVIEEDVEIEKDVTEIDNDHDTYDVGQVHTWIIQTSIPSGMAQGLKYEITDTLNYQLTYVGNVRVTLAEKTAAAGEDLAVLTEGEDYTLTVTPGNDENGMKITAFTVALTRSGMEKAAAAVGTEPEVRVYFEAYIDEDAVLGSEIPNQAHISYENSIGLDFDRDSDIPEAHTGGASILKVDTGCTPLAGATFQVYRDAAAEEIAEAVYVDGIEGPVIPVDFYDNAELTGEKVYTVTSDADGKGIIYGLAYGTYYLVETAAPEGYNLLTEPVVLTVDAASHTQDRAVTVVNSAGFTLPETGGTGTVLFMAVGGGIIALALVLMVPKKKKA